MIPRPSPKGRSQASRSRSREGDKDKGGAPIWRRDDETGQTYALRLIAAATKAIAVGETRPSEGEAERRVDHLIVSVDPKPEPGSDPAAAVVRPNSGVASTPTSPRGGTKIAQVIALLEQRRSPGGRSSAQQSRREFASAVSTTRTGHAAVSKHEDAANSAQFMPRSTTISIRSAISSPARFTNKGAPPRWPSGAPSRPNRRLGLRVLRPTQTTCRCSDKADQDRHLMIIAALPASQRRFPSPPPARRTRKLMSSRGRQSFCDRCDRATPAHRMRRRPVACSRGAVSR